MLTLLERVDGINHVKLTEGTREDILRSLFSLVNTNGGKFKSEKQAKFILDQTEGGEFFITQVLNFGTSRHSQRTVDWSIQCDDDGVVQIIKRTQSKGDEVYWSRDGQPDATTSIHAKRQDQKEQNKHHKRTEIEAIIVQLKDELATREGELQKATDAIDNPAAANVRDYLISRLPHYKQQAQELRDLIAKHEATLQNL